VDGDYPTFLYVCIKKKKKKGFLSFAMIHEKAKTQRKALLFNIYAVVFGKGNEF
jgi:hypothetical protein